MTPIPPATIMSLIQAGWRADILMRLAVRSVNGIGAHERIGGYEKEPLFFEMVSLMQRLQDEGGLSFRVEKRGEGEFALIVIPMDESPETQSARRELAEILDLSPGLTEYRLAFGQTPSGPDEIAMLTRSILEMLIDLAMWIDVPAEHVASGRTKHSPDPGPLEEWGFEPMIRVNSSSERPDSAFAIVRYEGLWYWIDHEDFRSKRTLSFMQLMFSLAESSSGQQAPVVTVQAGG